MDRGAWWAAVHWVAKSRTRLSDFPFTFHFHALEKEMATHSSVLAWRIPGTAEPGGLPSMGSHRVGHDWSNLAAARSIFVLGVLHVQSRGLDFAWVSYLQEEPMLACVVITMLYLLLMFFFFFFPIDFIVESSFWFIAKLSGTYRRFLYPPCFSLAVTPTISAHTRTVHLLKLMNQLWYTIIIQGP